MAVVTDNVYEVTIRATEMLAQGQSPPAKTSTLRVEVTVKDVDEPGSISLDRLQPQAGAELTASMSDPDRGAAGDHRAHECDVDCGRCLR